MVNGEVDICAASNDDWVERSILSALTLFVKGVHDSSSLKHCTAATVGTEDTHRVTR